MDAVSWFSSLYASSFAIIGCAGSHDAIQRIRNDIPFIKDLGVEFVSADNGRAVVALISPRAIEQLVCGAWGVLMTLLDVAMAVAGRSSILPPRGSHAGDENQLPAAGECRNPPHRLGARISPHQHPAFCDGEVRDTDQRLIAKPWAPSNI